jgi:hypothetical protein
MTTGQDDLQSAGVELLAQSREGMDRMTGPEETPGRWEVQEAYWSAAIARLKPKRVFIEPVFQNNQEGVRLMYGTGFLHWYIVIGPPGATLDPKLNEDRPDSLWFRWRDGVYCCFPD